MKRLEGKTALVTGAASGIGRATSILFAAEGANVVVLDRAEAVEETAAQIRKHGGRVTLMNSNSLNLAPMPAVIDPPKL
jgi:NAD(P)-dependent dehydrogenase (short-subunit alcohol dehydrogenase family)